MSETIAADFFTFMEGLIKINGIRLTRNFTQVTQDIMNDGDPLCRVLYQTMESGRINMVLMMLNTLGKSPFVSGTIASSSAGRLIPEGWICRPNVCTLSVYPHHQKLRFLGALFQLLGKQHLGFHYLISSSAMLTFVVDDQNAVEFIDMLCSGFDLPLSHAPFEQEENDDLVQFVKKKYPETRATYVEEKIKTYGMSLVTDLNLTAYHFSLDRLALFGQRLLSEEGRFLNVSGTMTADQQVCLYALTHTPMDHSGSETFPAELLSFHGPHFGDRHSIVSRAMTCLLNHLIPVLQVGCTGASIGIILPRGMGKKARQALAGVFESP